MKWLHIICLIVCLMVMVLTFAFSGGNVFFALQSSAGMGFTICLFGGILFIIISVIFSSLVGVIGDKTGYRLLGFVEGVILGDSMSLFIILTNLGSLVFGLIAYSIIASSGVSANIGQAIIGIAFLAVSIVLSFKKN